ncbi:MAG: hypothetical protein Q8797_01595, partial [Candidatus Phytoplasma australasiaticum]|nr:hypothetical protein [Candidatus Phytoplasma australasiaticum]
MALSVRQVLDKVVEELSLRCSPEVFKANFINMKNPYKIEKNTIFILVSDFIKTKIILMNYLDLINEISKKYSDADIFFKFLSDEDLLSNSDKNTANNHIKTTDSDNNVDLLHVDHSYDLKEFELDYKDDDYYSGLESKYNFDNFVTGESNDFTFR